MVPSKMKQSLMIAWSVLDFVVVVVVVVGAYYFFSLLIFNFCDA
jgi:hypothetical protein